MLLWDYKWPMHGKRYRHDYDTANERHKMHLNGDISIALRCVVMT